MPPLNKDQPDVCHCAALRKAARHVTQLYTGELRAVGLNANQFGILKEVSRQATDGIGLRGLADHLVVERSVLARNLRILEKQRFVTIVAPGMDRRLRLIKLTPAGRARLLKAQPAWQRAQQRFVDSVGVEESQQLRRLLAAARSARFS